MPRHSAEEQLLLFENSTVSTPIKKDSPVIVARILRDTPPVINIARHGAGKHDKAVQYITLMERCYTHGRVINDQEELKKAQNITINTDTVSIAGLKIERKKSGSMTEKTATKNQDFVPSLQEWQTIIDALPGKSEWHKSLQQILGIDIYKDSYWAWDVLEQKMKIVRMSGHEHERKINPKVPDDADQSAYIRFIVRKD